MHWLSIVDCRLPKQLFRRAWALGACNGPTWSVRALSQMITSRKNTWTLKRRKRLCVSLILVLQSMRGVILIQNYWSEMTWSGARWSLHHSLHQQRFGIVPYHSEPDIIYIIIITYMHEGRRPTHLLLYQGLRLIVITVSNPVGCTLDIP